MEAVGGEQPIVVLTKDLQLPVGKGRLPRKIEERFVAAKKLGTITFALQMELRERSMWMNAKKETQVSQRL
jgi:hypothetical protein